MYDPQGNSMYGVVLLILTTLFLCLSNETSKLIDAVVMTLHIIKIVIQGLTMNQK